jgi:hypothetical protein
MEVTLLLTEFKLITLPEVTEEDLDNLKKALTSDWLGQSIENVRDTILDGRALIWRYKSEEGSGIILTQEYVGTEKKELFIWYMGGKGMQPYGDYISEVLEEFCRIRGLEKVCALVKPGVERFLRQFGYRVDKHLISKEVGESGRHAEHNNNDTRHTPGV